MIPDAVAAELSSSGAPTLVREWILNPPTWSNIVTVPQEAVESVTDALDLGERSAIALAGSLQADLLLIDEAAGRAEARRRGLRATGTLGVLRVAAEQGLVDVPELMARLRATTFYVGDELLNDIFRPWLKP